VTCVECQELLLDLAYGELSGARAAEVELHLAGCDACRREQQQIAGARTLLAPLLRLEEPPASMDEPILRAARAEAERMAAASGMGRAAAPLRGPRIVEVVGSVGMPAAAAPIDVRAPVQSQAAPRPSRRRWALRVAGLGSLAAAAGLLVVFTQSSQMMQARTDALSVTPAAAPERMIHIRVPEEPRRVSDAAPEGARATDPTTALAKADSDQRARVEDASKQKAEAHDGYKLLPSTPRARPLAEVKMKSAGGSSSAQGESSIPVEFGDDVTSSGKASAQPSAPPHRAVSLAKKAHAEKDEKYVPPPPPPSLSAPAERPPPAPKMTAKEAPAVAMPAEQVPEEKALEEKKQAAPEARPPDARPPEAQPAQAAARAADEPPAEAAAAAEASPALDAPPAAPADVGQLEAAPTGVARDLPSAKVESQIANTPRASAVAGPPSADGERESKHARSKKARATGVSSALGGTKGSTTGDDLYGVGGYGNLGSRGSSSGAALGIGGVGSGTAAQLELRARAARVSGSYSEAATLYRQAAVAHQRAAEVGQQQYPASNQAPADQPLARRDVANQVAPEKGVPSKDQPSASQSLLAAAWDLAHAIECLVNDARIDEARRLYEDLQNGYRGLDGPLAAARRALRTALPPSPARKPLRSFDRSDADQALPAEAPAGPAEPPPPAADAPAKQAY
jgi:hypothetical protein